MACRIEISPAVLEALLRRERIIFCSRLLPGVVHNLSGAVQMISLPLDLAQLALNKGEVHTMEARLGSLRQGLERLTREVGLLATRSQSNQRRNSEPLDLALLVGEQLDFWRGDLFVKHELTLNRELSPAQGWAKASYADVALALNLLVANAVEAVRGSKTPWLTVRNDKRDGWYAIEVVDGGPGPSPEMAGSMFEPLTGDKGGEHEGLGLYLAAKALEPWGGRVAWRKGAPHTTFVLELPVNKP